MAYMNVVPPPAQPPPSLLCRTFKFGCPAPAVQNPDALAALYAPLAARVQGGYTTFRGIATLSGYRGMGCAGGQCHCGGKCKHGMGQADTSAPAPPTLGDLLNPFTAIPAEFNYGAQQAQQVASTLTSSLPWWAIGLAGLGGFWVLSNMVRGGKAVRKTYKRRRARAKKRESLLRQLKEV